MLMVGNLPQQPGLYWAQFDGAGFPNWNAILEVFGQAPFLRPVLHSFGNVQPCGCDPDLQIILVGPRIDVPAVLEHEAPKPSPPPKPVQPADDRRSEDDVLLEIIDVQVTNLLPNLCRICVYGPQGRRLYRILERRAFATSALDRLRGLKLYLYEIPAAVDHCLG